MKKIKYLLLIVTLGLANCSYEYMGKHVQRKFERTRRSSALRKIQIKQLPHSADGPLIYIEPIVTRDRGEIGIYGYNGYEDHFGQVNFFEYKDSVVTILNRSNLDSLQMKVDSFLNENNFSRRQIQRTKGRVKTIWAILSTDSF